jgi:pimeloyl-ACP methyl ester carboxylesterase
MNMQPAAPLQVRETHLGTPRGRIFTRTWEPADAGSRAAVLAKAPLVLFHDSLGCVELWRDFPANLARKTGRRVVAYDRLGFGQSSPYPGPPSSRFIMDEATETFAAVRETLELDAFVPFGHSVGGGMAVVCAATYSGQCREQRTLDGIVAADESFRQESQFARLTKYHGDKARWVLRAWVDTWLSEEFLDWSLDAELPRVQCPLLAIHGENDEFGSVAQPERIRSRAGGPVSVRILADCGHVPHREMQDVVLAHVDDFLASASS